MPSSVAVRKGQVGQLIPTRMVQLQLRIGTQKAAQGSEDTSLTLVNTIHNDNVPVRCLSMTAIATVSAGDRCTKLFDEGAQRPFVSQKLDDQLQLHPHNTENISISSFGAESAISKQLSTAITDVVMLNSDRVPVTGLYQ